MYIRRITRNWVNKSGETITKIYYYWYQSKRIGNKVISECIGPATEEDYLKLKNEEAYDEIIDQAMSEEAIGSI